MIDLNSFETMKDLRDFLVAHPDIVKQFDDFSNFIVDHIAKFKMSEDFYGNPRMNTVWLDNDEEYEDEFYLKFSKLPKFMDTPDYTLDSIIGCAVTASSLVHLVNDERLLRFEGMNLDSMKYFNHVK